MVIETDLSIEQEILSLLEHLGIEKAHFGARVPRDWQSLVKTHPEAVASLSLLCPRSVDPGALAILDSRLLVIAGDQGDDAGAVRRGMENLPHATSVALENYSPGNETDLIADRAQEIGDTILDFLGRANQEQMVQTVTAGEGDGQWGGILYRIQGSGPPLVLLPLQYSPSQWDQLVDRLSQSYCTITLSGPRVGSVFSLETRAQGGYLSAVKKVVEEANLQPGERVLDIGCGPGSLDPWLAGHTSKSNPIVGVDPSTYLLREAAAMVSMEGLEDVIRFQESGGDSLPFPDNSFDVAMSFTVFQYLDADRMLKEMMRVTGPGGRVAVLARGDDRPNLINVPLRAELKSKTERVRTQRHNELGCNDASLYRRFHQAGLTKVKMFPQLAVFTPASDGPRLDDVQDRFLHVLDAEELDEFRAALGQALGDGSFFVAEWFHCAVGTNPG